MRILWYARKYMDVSLDAATWVETVKELQALGHTVRLVTGYRRERTGFGLGAAIRYVRSIRVRYLNYLSFIGQVTLRLPVECLRFAPDVVLVDPGTHVPALVAASVCRVMRRRGRRPAFVLDVRTLPLVTGRSGDSAEERGFARAIRRCARHLDGVTTITRALAGELERIGGLPAGSIGWWTSGVDAAAFDPDACPDERPAADVQRVLYHGALLATRGLDDAIRAMALLEGPTARRVHLELLGSGVDTEALVSLVNECGVGDRVSVSPAVSQAEVPSAICRCDIGLLPFPDHACWRVSSPLKLFEYLAMERPVIVTDIDAHRDVLGDAPYAVYAPSSDPRDLAEAMIEAYRRRDELRAAACEGRALVLREYTWEVQAARLASLLEREVDRARG